MFLGGCSFQTATAGSVRLGMWGGCESAHAGRGGEGWECPQCSLSPFKGEVTGSWTDLSRLTLPIPDLGREERREGSREERTQEEARGEGEMRESRGGPETWSQLCANW